MKKEMILPAPASRPAKSAGSLFTVFAMCRLWCAHTLPVLYLSRYYSRLLGEEVTPLHTLRLIHAQLAFLMLVFPWPFPLAVRALFCLWFALVLLRCQRSSRAVLSRSSV